MFADVFILSECCFCEMWLLGKGSLIIDHWSKEHGCVEEKDRVVYAFCCESVVCRTSSVQRHSHTKHQSNFKTSDEKS